MVRTVHDYFKQNFYIYFSGDMMLTGDQKVALVLCNKVTVYLLTISIDRLF